MTAQIRTIARAEQQIQRVSKWWRKNRPAAPALFEDEIGAAFTAISANPDVGLPFQHRKVRGVRRLLLAATRYHVYYVHVPAKAEVAVLAVWSAVRGRGPALSKP